MGKFSCTNIRKDETPESLTLTLRDVSSSDAWTFQVNYFGFDGEHYPIRISDVTSTGFVQNRLVAVEPHVHPNDGVMPGTVVGELKYDGSTLEIWLSKLFPDDPRSFLNRGGFPTTPHGGERSFAYGREKKPYERLSEQMIAAFTELKF